MGQVERRIGLFDQEFHAGRTLCRSRRHYEARCWAKVLSHNLSRYLNRKLRRPRESLMHFRLAELTGARHYLLAFRRFLGPRKAARWQEPTDSRGFSQFPTTGRILLCALAPRAQAEIAESVQIPMNQACFVPPESAKGQITYTIGFSRHQA
jgi:hypothetical protein